MESLTKNKQTNDNLTKMITAAFGEQVQIGDGVADVKIKELKEGFFNVAYDIKLSNKSVILKIAPPVASNIMSYENNMMEAEVKTMQMVKEKTSVPVPAILYYDNTHTICAADYFFMEKLDGNNFFLEKDKMPFIDQESILEEIGRYNDEMNQITGKSYGYFSQMEKHGSNWEDVFANMIETVLQDGERIKIDIGTSYEEVRMIVEKAKGELKDLTSPKLVHWDLWEGNVFVKDGKITGIIDFERSLWGDPLMEYYFRAHSTNESFTRGYGEDLRKKYPKKAYLYDIYLYLIMTIETKYRCYPDDGQYNFASAELRTAMEHLKKLL